MKPIPGNIPKHARKVEEATLICLHYKDWPPAPARMKGDLEALRASKEITEPMYQQTLVWKRTCGLTAMEEQQCLECPLVRKLVKRNLEWYADNLDGTPGKKVTDWKKAGAGAKYRRGPKEKIAAWVKNKNGEDQGGNA
jgi:hypothetical protein